MPQVYRRSSSVEAAPMQNETILFNSTTGGFCVLNPSAAVIWNSLETPQPVAVLAAQLYASFAGVSEEQALKDVTSVLAEFSALALVELEP